MEEKRKYNDICLHMEDRVRKMVEKSEEPLHAAAKAAILGNLIDLGIGMQFDLEKDLIKIMSEPLGADDFDEMNDKLRKGGRKILYLGDNAGEIVFDKIFIQMLVESHDVTFTVKSGPIINDSTMEDAIYTGMTDIVTVIETGSDGIGVQWDSVSKEFIEKYGEADIIISKGQGNFETMNGRQGDIFFMLRAKCESVAKELGVKFGDTVFRRKYTERKGYPDILSR